MRCGGLLLARRHVYVAVSLWAMAYERSQICVILRDLGINKNCGAPMTQIVKLRSMSVMYCVLCIYGKNI